MRASLIIPAYNEEAVIGRCLRALADQPGIDDVHVIVAVNGSRDATAQVARSLTDIPRLSVLEIPQASKVAALNAADRHADLTAHAADPGADFVVDPGADIGGDRAVDPAADPAGPGQSRIYLDADIILGPNTLGPLVEALQSVRALVATPAIRFDLDRSSRLVRRFYRVFSQLPYATDHLVGLGVYGISAAGRRRFGQFPDVIADDLFVQQLFAVEDRVATAGSFHVMAPESVGDLIRVRTRVAKGVTQLERRAATGGLPDRATGSTAWVTVSALLRLLRRNPGSVLDVAAYVLITLIARGRAARSDVDTWHRDESTRRPPMHTVKPSDGPNPSPNDCLRSPTQEEVRQCLRPSASSSRRTTRRA